MDNANGFNSYKKFTTDRKIKGNTLKPLVCKISKQPFISIDDKLTVKSKKNYRQPRKCEIVARVSTRDTSA